MSNSHREKCRVIGRVFKVPDPPVDGWVVSRGSEKYRHIVELCGLVVVNYIVHTLTIVLRLELVLKLGFNEKYSD